MEMYIQQMEGLKAIGGGKETRQEIEQLKQLQQDSEGRISRIEQTQATEDTAGLVTLCDLPDVTNSTGKALPASEKNAARIGTLAYVADGAARTAESVRDELSMVDCVPHIQLGDRTLEHAVMDLLTAENFSGARVRSFMLYSPERNIWAFVHAEKWDVNFSGYCICMQNRRFFVFQRNIQSGEGLGWMQKIEFDGTFTQDNS